MSKSSEISARLRFGLVFVRFQTNDQLKYPLACASGLYLCNFTRMINCLSKMRTSISNQEQTYWFFALRFLPIANALSHKDTNATTVATMKMAFRASASGCRRIPTTINTAQIPRKMISRRIGFLDTFGLSWGVSAISPFHSGPSMLHQRGASILLATIAIA